MRCVWLGRCVTFLPDLDVSPSARCCSHRWLARVLTSHTGGDRPSDVLEQAKVRKAQGFTRVKMNVSDLSCKSI